MLQSLFPSLPSALPRFDRPHGLAPLALVVLALCVLPRGVTGNAPFPFTENFEGALGDYWTLGDGWGATTQSAHSGGSSLTDSPNGSYQNSQDRWATLAVDLTTASRPYLSFWHRYEIENNRDFGSIEYSHDNGATWDRRFVVTGSGGTNWHNTRVNLSWSTGRVVLLRFRLATDGQNSYDGWYIDDVEIKNADTEAPYPFADDMDGADTESKWIPSAWRLVSGSAQKTTGKSWRCQIGDGNVGFGTPVLNLIPIGVMDFGGASRPFLSFRWAAKTPQNYTALSVWISGNNGRDWEQVWRWDSGYQGTVDWTRTQVDLGKYIGLGQVTFSFVALSPSGYAVLDYSIDDVRVDDGPNDVLVKVEPGTDPRHNALVSWEPSDAPDFGYYAVYRATRAPADTLITKITDRDQTWFEDTELDICGQTYFYRVQVVDTTGINTSGLIDVPYRTAWADTITTFPFSETMDGSDRYWAMDRPWGFTDEKARSGRYSLTDSPKAMYPDNFDRSATLRADFRNLNRPYLTFWQRYTMENNRDFGIVEVSIDDGANWARHYVVTGFGGTNWYNPKIDLAGYAGRTALIRFRLSTDAQNRYDGWYVEDVGIKDMDASAGYPFVDDMNANESENRWFSSGWKRVTGSAQSSTGKSWRCQMGDDQRAFGYWYSDLSQAATLDLSGASNPQLSFWWAALAPNRYTQLFVDVSGNGGQSWDNVWRWDSGWGGTTAWARAQADLNKYVGLGEVRIRFRAYNSNNSALMDFSVDDVQVADVPIDVLAQATPGSDPRHSALITWEPSDAPDFAYYALYRGTKTPADTLVAKITDRNTTSYEDTALELAGYTYYYRVLVVSTSGLNNTGLTDIPYRTRMGDTVAVYPFLDTFENGDQYWALERPWALSADKSHSGGKALTDSPGTTYANNLDRSAYLVVNTKNLSRPYLSFWQRYTLESNRDFGFVEVSADEGRNWWRAYAVTGFGGTNWYNIRIDLSGQVGPNKLIRFRLITDAQNRYDGWYVDDVEIKDNKTELGYPLYDAMDDPDVEGRWLSSMWKRAEGGAQSPTGRSWLCQMGDGSLSFGPLSAYLAPAGTFDLSSATAPQLSFWFATKAAQYSTALQVVASPNGGQTWEQVYRWDSGWGGNLDWTHVQVDLSKYAGSNQVMIVFNAYYGNSYGLSYWLDDVLVSDAGTHQVWINQGPDGIPNPSNPDQPVQCAVAAQDTWGYPLTYAWTCSGGTFQDTGSKASTSARPSWSASSAGSYTITVKLSSANDTNVVAEGSFVEQVTTAQLAAVAKPRFSPASGAPAPLTVAITTTTLGAIIRYTTDGSDPSSGSPIYSKPLSLTVPTTLKARAFLAGLPDSDISTATYPSGYNSADYEPSFWVLDAAEVSRVLAYWRAGAYHIDPTGLDGYAAGTGSTSGSKHTADYATPTWAISGAEANRILAYWRAGGYHKDASGVDGFAPGRPAGLASAGSTRDASSCITAVHQEAPATYRAGDSITVVNQVAYSEKPIALLWRPRLPAGWKIASVSGDGNPEIIGGEILWTDEIPSSPIRMAYRVETPADQTGLQDIGGELDTYASGQANASTASATPAPLVLAPEGSGVSQISAVERKTDGTIQVTLRTQAGGWYRLEVSSDLVNWASLGEPQQSGGTLLIADPESPTESCRFYRAVLCEQSR